MCSRASGKAVTEVKRQGTVCLIAVRSAWVFAFDGIDSNSPKVHRGDRWPIPILVPSRVPAKSRGSHLNFADRPTLRAQHTQRMEVRRRMIPPKQSVPALEQRSQERASSRAGTDCFGGI